MILLAVLPGWQVHRPGHWATPASPGNRAIDAVTVRIADHDGPGRGIGAEDAADQEIALVPPGPVLVDDHPTWRPWVSSSGSRRQRPHQGAGAIGSDCLSAPNCATVATPSEPGSAGPCAPSPLSSFFVEGGETYGRTRDQPGLPRCEPRNAAALAATRYCPPCALPLLPDGKIRVLAVGQPARPGRLPRLPAASIADRDVAGMGAGSAMR